MSIPTRVLLACTILLLAATLVFSATVYADLLNLPSKPEILALPPAGQRAVVRQAQPGLMLLGLMVAGVSAYLQYAAWNVAHGRSAGGLGSLVIVVPLVSVALMPTILFPVRRELRRQQAALD